VRPNASQANPKQSVGREELGFAGLAFEHSELMSERQIFEHESGMGLESREQATEKQQKEPEHDGPTSADEIEKSTFSTAYGVFATNTGIAHSNHQAFALFGVLSSPHQEFQSNSPVDLAVRVRQAITM